MSSGSVTFKGLMRAVLTVIAVLIFIPFALGFIGGFWGKATSIYDSRQIKSLEQDVRAFQACHQSRQCTTTLEEYEDYIEKYERLQELRRAQR